MINPKVVEMLKKLTESVQAGFYTSGRTVESETLVCFIQTAKDGSVTYYQHAFERLTLDWQKSMRGKKAGDRVGSCKITGVWDMWDSKDRVYPPG